MRLQDRNVIVTGGAQGIGRGIVERLAREGANVMIGDLNGDGAAEVAAELSGQGMNVEACEVDVSVRQSTVDLISSAVESFGRLDVMFNNAGFNKPEQFLDITEDTWHRVMDVNALGVLIGTQEAGKQMISQGEGGKIINTASIASRQGFPAFAPYCASKAAVLSIIQAAARALAQHEITVNGFAPGVVDTPLWQQLDSDLMDIGESERPGQAMEDFSAGILVGRPAQPDDIAGTALFLASADSDYMTGQVVMIDGGMVLV
jgi:meso-butanediol dehydrogenase/(S,S)-butanediol dehydrogenase/diacetyl reductase